jgi:hypothetical protein
MTQRWILKTPHLIQLKTQRLNHFSTQSQKTKQTLPLNSS